MSKATVSGPPVYENWKLSVNNKDWNESFEVPLFTDAHITSKNVLETFGPYEFINTIPMRNGFLLLQPAIVLRVNSYLTYSLPDMSKTQEENYHGGGLVEEIAALISLTLGIRIKAGITTRIFPKGGDPRGFPISYGTGDNPIIPLANHASIIPNAIETHLLNDAEIISKLPSLLPEQATALLKSARLYQNGMWVSETDPQLAWILFVSAIEVAAESYWKSENNSLSERLEFSRPAISKILKEHGDIELENKISEQLADITGSRRKFTGFIIEFLPAPPIKRPEEWAQLNWDNNSIKKSINKIYDYRSRSLHGGTPFPVPMLQPPLYKSFDTKACEEVPSGTSISHGKHVWLKKDLPMNLNIFEYIVRKSLINWWNNMALKALNTK